MSKTIPETSFRYVTSKERFKIGLLSSLRQLRDSWRIYARNKLAVLGALLLVIYLLMAVAHPILMRSVWPKAIYDPVIGHDVNIHPHPSPLSRGHLLGTDALGRDVLSILMAATGPSLQMALTAALTAAVIGTLVGALSAYFRGPVDGLFSHLADLSLLAPAPIVMVVIGFMLDIDPLKFGLLYGFLVGVGGVATVLRAHAFTIMNKTFIDAARMAGGGPSHIIGRHLIPHMLPLAAVNMLLTVTGAIFANGFIAFLGLSRAQLNWGSMIYDAETYRQINGAIAWNVMVPSALAISLFAASFYMIALGLHDVAEPRAAVRLARVVRIPAARRSLTWLTGRSQAAALPVASQPVAARVTKQLAAGAPVAPADAPAEPLPASVQPIPLAADPGLQARMLETYQIAVMVVALQNGAELSADSCPPSFDPMAEIEQRLVINGGLVERLNDGSLVASFGLFSHAPAQASALMAVRASLDLMRLVERLNDQHTNADTGRLKMSVGISSGEASFQDAEPSDWIVPVLSTQAGLIARSLGNFAGFMRNGGVLICEHTYSYLGAVKHHFIFGRQGMARLPVETGQGMVYELRNSSNPD
ncbi:MAG: ABC transporter permease subunit [Anaerolineales bacterium]|nr:ABC transporter permease subunit [Anaerolineales bacterium]